MCGTAIQGAPPLIRARPARGAQHMEVGVLAARQRLHGAEAPRGPAPSPAGRRHKLLALSQLLLPAPHIQTGCFAHYVGGRMGAGAAPPTAAHLSDARVIRQQAQRRGSAARRRGGCCSSAGACWHGGHSGRGAGAVRTRGPELCACTGVKLISFLCFPGSDRILKS
jgi:hypothetical protein